MKIGNYYWGKVNEHVCVQAKLTKIKIIDGLEHYKLRGIGWFLRVHITLGDAQASDDLLIGL